MKSSRSQPRISLALVALATLAACSSMAQGPAGVGIGPNPSLPAPEKKIIPTVNIAPAQVHVAPPQVNTAPAYAPSGYYGDLPPEGEIAPPPPPPPPPARPRHGYAQEPGERG